MNSAKALMRVVKSTVAAPTNSVAPVASQAKGSACAVSGFQTVVSSTNGTWTGSPTFVVTYEGSSTSISGPWTPSINSLMSDISGFYPWVRSKVVATNAGGSTTAYSSGIAATDYGCTSC